MTMSRSGERGSESTRAIEIPPRNPPQVRIQIVPFGIGFLSHMKPMGSPTLIRRPSRDTAVAIRPATKYDG